MAGPGPFASHRGPPPVIAGGAVIETSPKTKRSARCIELDVVTLAALKAWQKRQQAEREERAGKWPDHDLVFTLQDGTPLNLEQVSRAFRAHVRAAGVPAIRLHDLRHTHATLMMAAGVNPRIVSDRLGHSTVALTLDIYSHVTAGMGRGAAQAVADSVDAVAKLKVAKA